MEQSWFKQFKIESLTQLHSLKPSEVKIFRDEPVPENFTIVVRPEDKILTAIEKEMSALKKIEPNQFYYPLSDLHLTLVGNIPTTIDQQKITIALESIIKHYQLEFKLEGLGSNKYCSSFSAYPIDFSLHKLREELRSRIGIHGDNYQNILPSYEYVGWINYLRYLQIPGQKFLNRLYENRGAVFGQFRPSSVQLFRNTSKVLASPQAQLITEISLV